MKFVFKFASREEGEEETEASMDESTSMLSNSRVKLSGSRIANNPIFLAPTYAFGGPGRPKEARPLKSPPHFKGSHAIPKGDRIPVP